MEKHNLNQLKIKRMTYMSKYIHSWSSQLHLLDHSTGISHISRDLIANILWWSKIRSKHTSITKETQNQLKNLTWLKACNFPLMAAAPVVTWVIRCHLLIDLSLKPAMLQDTKMNSIKCTKNHITTYKCI